MGFIGSGHILFNGVNLSLVEYVVKFIGAILLAFVTGLATSYASHLVDKLKNKDNGTPRKRSRRKAA